MSAGREGTQASGGGPGVTDAGRLAAFSDGVFAIVITLLVLDLRVPEFHEGGLAEGLLGEGPAYLAFVVSFIYVGVLWLNHHAVLQLVRGTTAAFSSINLGILFGVVIIPFPTAVLASALADGNTDDLRVAVVLYAFAAALMSAPWWVLFAYVRRHPELRADSVDQEQVRVQEARSIVGLVLYGLTGVLGWLVTPLLGLIGVVVMIIFHGATSQGLRHGDGLFGSLMGGAVLDAERIDGYLYEEAGEHLGTGLGMRTRGVVGVFNIAVVPGARGRGLGRAITEKVLREGVAAGADAAYLQTSALGRPLYESMGFRLLENWTAFHA